MSLWWIHHLFLALLTAAQGSQTHSLEERSQRAYIAENTWVWTDQSRMNQFFEWFFQVNKSFSFTSMFILLLFYYSLFAEALWSMQVRFCTLFLHFLPDWVSVLSLENTLNELEHGIHEQIVLFWPTSINERGHVIRSIQQVNHSHSARRERKIWMCKNNWWPYTNIAKLIC